MRRLTSLGLFTVGDLSLAALDPGVALAPALLSFIGAAYVLVGSGEPATATK